MYKSGIVNHNFFEKEQLQEYLEAIDIKEVTFLSLSLDCLTEQLTKMDSLVIFSDYSGDSTAKICSLIMQIRQQTEIPIWIVQEESDSISRLVFLQLGATHNLPKDCSPAEIQILLAKDIQHKYSFQTDHYLVGNRKDNFPGKHHSEEQNFTKKEANVLQLLQRDTGKICTYEEIYQEVWKKPYRDQKSRVANVVFHIRSKLDRKGMNMNYIRTVHGVGYIIND